ncbi:MAG: FtsH protease activity modulator HflK [Lachnospiraceae bacterium]|nr:FtsH protease activity modulator HflK [Lachnospiraceae bacterium]MBR1862135.1 FtsH protease activity modulator HflK [Lachnospiraceae bacterium]
MAEFEKYEDPNVKKAKKVLRIILLPIIGIFVLIIIFNCFYSVNEQRNAVVTQFGKIVKVNTAGFYLKAPWQKVHMVDMTTHGTGIGYIVSSTGQNITDTDNGVMITSDFNLLNIDFYLEYRVSDPVAYLYNSESPENILSNIALANIRTTVSNYTVDEAMTTGKSQIQADVKDAMIEELNNRQVGLTVVNITIQDSEPPTDEIIAAFKAVETAKQGADTAMNNAHQYQNQKIPEAEAKADAIIQGAEAQKESRIAEAEGQVARFNEIYAEYEKYPLITKKRLFYEKMEEILPGLKVIITDGNTETMLPLDSFMSENAKETINNYTNNTVSGAATDAE